MTPSVTQAEATGDAVVDDLYPLSSLQRGLLFHLLRDPHAAEHISQIAFRRHGVDPDSVRAAWELLARRHPVLRTGFLWKGLTEPVQVVYRWAAPPVHERDLRELSPAERERVVAEFLAEDRDTGFAPDAVPPARLALLRLTDDVVQVVWTHHTILLDGWSSALLFTDLDRVETALAVGDEPPPVPGPAFRDYVARVRDHDPDVDAAYWREFLAGVDSATPLPLADARRGDAGSGAQHEIRLSTADSARVVTLSRDLGVPFGVLAQGAWALALSRTTGLDDVLFGLVVSGRTMDLPGVDQVVGALTNTVPVRVRVRGTSPVRAWLRDLATRHAATMAHEHSPLTEVRRHSGVPGGRPLFETALVVQNFPVADDDRADRPPRVSHVEGYESAALPMVVFLLPDERITVRVAYRRGAVSERAARTMADALAAALTGLTDPGRPVDAVPVLTALAGAHGAAARGPERDWPGPDTLAEVFAAAVAATPDAVAVVGEGVEMTYEELDRCAESLAGTLTALGAGVERRVGVVVDRSVDSVTAMLAVLKAGAVYVPVDPAYPQARVTHLLTDSACHLVVTRSDMTAALPPEVAETARVVLLDDLPEDQPADHNGRVHGQNAAVRPDNLAYVIYTSGSTGVPKGVMVSHRAVLNTLRCLTDEFGLTGRHRVAHKVPIGFTDAIFEVLWPLCAGASVSVVDNETVRDPDALLALLRDQHVTHAQLVPRQIEAFAADGAARGVDPLPELEWVVNASEPLPVAFAAQWDAVFERARINNIYGMTESAIFAVWQHLPRGHAAEVDAVPIGLPMPNTVARVLGAALEPCPPGVPGEVYVGGIGIARGYLGARAMTADRFVPDPYGAPGERLYRTGDRGALRPDGSLEYLGRKDFQVKVRGMRVEPGEVEVALRAHPTVRDAVVTGHDGRLVAHLVPVGADRPEPAEIRTWLARSLPEHLVPALLTWLDELPMTAHGKVDRPRLPAPVPEPEAEFVPPRTAVERVLAGIWAEVLGHPEVGALADFFAMGGDSLSAIRVVSRVRETFPVDYAVGALFDEPTVAGAAELVSGLLDADGGELGDLLAEIEDLPAGTDDHG